MGYEAASILGSGVIPTVEVLGRPGPASDPGAVFALAAALRGLPPHTGPGNLGGRPGVTRNRRCGNAVRILERLPEGSQVAVYAVPDERVGDLVMAAVVLRHGMRLEPADFERSLVSQPDLPPKVWPRTCGSTRSCRLRRRTRS
jgi:hypothetical protein